MRCCINICIAYKVNFDVRRRKSVVIDKIISLALDLIILISTDFVHIGRCSWLISRVWKRYTARHVLFVWQYLSLRSLNAKSIGSRADELGRKGFSQPCSRLLTTSDVNRVDCRSLRQSLQMLVDLTSKFGVIHVYTRLWELLGVLGIHIVLLKTSSSSYKLLFYSFLGAASILVIFEILITNTRCGANIMILFLTIVKWLFSCDFLILLFLL